MGLIQKKDEKDEIDGIQIIERGEGPDGDEEEKIDLVAGTSAEHIAAGTTAEEEDARLEAQIAADAADEDLMPEEQDEDDDILAFKDINPARPVHVLVIPKRHITSLATATAEDTLVLGKILAKANEIAVEQGSPEGFRVIINTGRVGQQEVQHLHAHIVGGPDPVGPMLKRI